jgi:hypothetical protein
MHEFLFDIVDDFALGGGREGVAALIEDLPHRRGSATARKIQPHDGMRQRVVFVDRGRVADAVARVEYTVGRTTRALERMGGWKTPSHKATRQQTEWTNLLRQKGSLSLTSLDRTKLSN